MSRGKIDEPSACEIDYLFIEMAHIIIAKIVRRKIGF